MAKVFKVTLIDEAGRNYGGREMLADTKEDALKMGEKDLVELKAAWDRDGLDATGLLGAARLEVDEGREASQLDVMGNAVAQLKAMFGDENVMVLDGGVLDKLKQEHKEKTGRDLRGFEPLEIKLRKDASPEEKYRAMSAKNAVIVPDDDEGKEGAA